MLSQMLLMVEDSQQNAQELGLILLPTLPRVQPAHLGYGPAMTLEPDMYTIIFNDLYSHGNVIILYGYIKDI